MAIVVTGAAGFLGRDLVTALLARGERVVGIDRAPQPHRPGLLVLTGDLLAVDDLMTAALNDADAVFHLAGCPGVRDARPDVAAHRRRDNVLATARVLAAVPSRTPLVVTSSSSVYGGAAGGRPSAEGDLLRPRGGYARSKLRVEQLCAARLAHRGHVLIARPFTVAGEGQRADMAVARWLHAARCGLPLRVLGGLGRTRDITDVRDVTRALLALADRGVHGPVNIGTGTAHSLAEVAAAACAAVGRSDVEVDVSCAGPHEPPDTLADTRRLQRWAGFVPRTDLAALVARQAAAAAGACPVSDALTVPVALP